MLQNRTHRALFACNVCAFVLKAHGHFLLCSWSRLDLLSKRLVPRCAQTAKLVASSELRAYWTSACPMHPCLHSCPARGHLFRHSALSSSTLWHTGKPHLRNRRNAYWTAPPAAVLTKQQQGLNIPGVGDLSKLANVDLSDVPDGRYREVEVRLTCYAQSFKDNVRGKQPLISHCNDISLLTTCRQCHMSAEDVWTRLTSTHTK